MNLNAPRKDWPVEVLTKVFLELQDGVPYRLLYDELWFHSKSSVGWYDRLVRFSHSLAAMSMIGYIIGLGDRHLDNILVDFSCGQVVHIDFSVCFDKGKLLRVPETVPFRLTRLLCGALGFVGTDGIFKSASVNMLGLLRRNEESVLSVLESFVEDPLSESQLVEDNAGSLAILDCETTFIGKLRSALEEIACELRTRLFEIQHYTSLLIKSVEDATGSLQSLSLKPTIPPVASLFAALQEHRELWMIRYKNHQKAFQVLRSSFLARAKREIEVSFRERESIVRHPATSLGSDLAEPLARRLSEAEMRFERWHHLQYQELRHCLSALVDYAEFIHPALSVQTDGSILLRASEIVDTFLMSDLHCSDFVALLDRFKALRQSKVERIEPRLRQHFKEALSASQSEVSEKADRWTSPISDLGAYRDSVVSLLATVHDSQERRLLLLFACLDGLNRLEARIQNRGGSEHGVPMSLVRSGLGLGSDLAAEASIGMQRWLDSLSLCSAVDLYVTNVIDPEVNPDTALSAASEAVASRHEALVALARFHDFVFRQVVPSLLCLLRRQGSSEIVRLSAILPHQTRICVKDLSGSMQRLALVDQVVNLRRQLEELGLSEEVSHDARLAASSLVEALSQFEAFESFLARAQCGAGPGHCLYAAVALLANVLDCCVGSVIPVDPECPPLTRAGWKFFLKTQKNSDFL